MGISVFLSHPSPCEDRLREFIGRVAAYLASRGIEPRTLGVSDYDMSAPLESIRRLMLECNGALVVALRRHEIEQGRKWSMDREGERNSSDLSGSWMTSPWCHIETGMAFQLALPLLILRERGVIAEGVLEPGVTGLYMPEFDLDRTMDSYFESPEWRQLISQFESDVRQLHKRKGIPTPPGVL
jgi:hypothetical protein